MGECVRDLAVIGIEDDVVHSTCFTWCPGAGYSWTRIPAWDYAPNGRLSIRAEVYVWWRKESSKTLER